MYKIEIFDEKMKFASSAAVSKSEYIELDYFSYDAYTIQTPLITKVKKGYFVHITEGSRFVADGIVSDVRPEKKTQKISIRPIQALFDVEVFFEPVTDCITWISERIKEQFVRNEDSLQNRPVDVSATPESDPLPLTENIDEDSTDTINILSVIQAALKTYGVWVNTFIDMSTLRIKVQIYKNKRTRHFEADLENVLESSVTLGDSYGSTNKLVIQKYTVTEPDKETDPDAEPEIKVIGNVIYYLHTDQTIDKNNTKRIFPVFWKLLKMEYDNKESRYESFAREKRKEDPSLTDDQLRQLFKQMVDEEWDKAATEKAYEVLLPKQFDQEIILSYHREDLVAQPNNISIGTVATIHLKGQTYNSILAGRTYMGDVTKLTFGAVRTELTKKLSIEKLNGSNVTTGGSAVSNTKKGSDDYNALNHKPSINGVTLYNNKEDSELLSVIPIEYINALT